MDTSLIRLARIRQCAIAVGVFGTAGGLALILYGLIGKGVVAWHWPVTAGGALIVLLATGLMLFRVLLKIESNTSRLHDEARDALESLQRIHDHLKMIAENTSISEAAKSIAYRTREREALHNAIHEGLRNGDFESVFHLIEELETRLGYAEEAERLRLEARDTCAEAFKAKLREALTHINRLCDEHRWDQAKREIERLEKLMPNEARVKELWDAMARKREAYKQALIREWDTAVRNSDVERGINLLRELDPYLSREEARALESPARNMFKERLLLLGAQFQFAVSEQRWRDALASGLQIIEEFPNSKMSREVQERLDALRARAGLPADVEVTARGQVATHGSDPGPT